MAIWTATIIIEPHLLLREALESLIKNYRYRIVCSVGSTADIVNPSMVGEGPKLVILGAQSADDAVTEAAVIRKLWSDSKIVLLFEYASTVDCQKLLASEINGCVPLFVSPETLIRTLDLVMIEDARIMITTGTRRPSIRPAQTKNIHQLEIEMAPPLGGTEQDAVPIALVGRQQTWPTVNVPGASPLNGYKSDVERVPTLRNRPRLSEREAQILDGLVRGHANKVIARSCDITEATVKVHMKSILRKIQVANRTQAAVWALENGHFAAVEPSSAPVISSVSRAYTESPSLRSVSLASPAVECSASGRPILS
jgi:two-component system, NarL family, nitrate/nitrite response regulator NarL